MLLLKRLAKALDNDPFKHGGTLQVLRGGFSLVPSNGGHGEGADGAVPARDVDQPGHAPGLREDAAAGDAAGALLREASAQGARSRVLRQRVAGGNRGAEDGLHAGSVERDEAVPVRPQPGRGAAVRVRPPCAGALRGVELGGGDDHPPGRAEDEVPAVQPGQRSGQGQPAEPGRVGVVVLLGGDPSARHVAADHRVVPAHPGRDRGGSRHRRQDAGGEDPVPPLPPVAGRDPPRRGRPRTRLRPEVSDPALRGFGQDQLDRVARPPALPTPRRGQREGVRHGRRGDRPHGARQAAPGRDRPVRAPRWGGEVDHPSRRRLEVEGARRGFDGREADRDRHHPDLRGADQADQHREAVAGAPVRGDRRRGPLVADRLHRRRADQGPVPRRARRRGRGR